MIYIWEQVDPLLLYSLSRIRRLQSLYFLQSPGPILNWSSVPFMVTYAGAEEHNIIALHIMNRISLELSSVRVFDFTLLSGMINTQ